MVRGVVWSCWHHAARRTSLSLLWMLWVFCCCALSALLCVLRGPWVVRRRLTQILDPMMSPVFLIKHSSRRAVEPDDCVVARGSRSQLADPAILAILILIVLSDLILRSWARAGLQ